MRALLTSLTIISAISLSSAAFAANSTTGTIRAVDAKAMTLTLKNGTSYVLPAGFKDSGLKAGEKVKIAYDVIGKKHQATAITPVQ
ncbi:DUF1344 domain-containing protein [Pararhizobium gei]|uniref:DUF1344 domain-containing protein n=1 Tax=Pararhizobium gei TaxID=1395951 RepID=UPI0023DC305B|nr:DUF1344 domain-containing protein [Rhizobium gei]